MHHIPQKTFPVILRKERLGRGWSQQEVADRLNDANPRAGVLANTISRWERGISLPFPIHREHLGTIFEMTQEELGLLPEGGPAVLLSGAVEDGASMGRFKASLEKRGIIVWSEKQDQRHVERNEVVRHALQGVQAVVLIASPSVKASAAVKKELLLAESCHCPVFGFWSSGMRRFDVLPADQTVIRAIDLFDGRGPHYEEAMDELVSTLTAFSTASQQSAKLSDSPQPALNVRNPYKGLQAFGREDVRYFFGRERLINSLLTQVETIFTQEKQDGTAARLLSVIGPSGSGKSSAVMAGLLPMLEIGDLPGSEQWVYLPTMTPGHDPLEALCQILGQHFPERSLTEPVSSSSYIFPFQNEADADSQHKQHGHQSQPAEQEVLESILRTIDGEKRAMIRVHAWHQFVAINFIAMQPD